MKRGKDEDKTMGPMFPRLHVNDTEKGGPRAPPRNKMALYEQLSIPSQRFNGGVSSFNPNTTANSIPPSSSTPGPVNERGTFSPIQQSSSMHPFTNQQRVQQQEHKRRQEDDDFTVPIFDQQSGTSQNHQNRENENERITQFNAPFSSRLANVHNARQTQNENSQDFARSASNQPHRQNPKSKVPLKVTNESTKFRDYRGDSQADNSLWGESGLNEASKARDYENTSVPLMEVQREASRSPNNGDAVSETSMVDSICGVDISPDDVVGIIGQKHFWKARRAIVNQQRVFAVQVFELHRLIKVQRLIAGSPHLVFEESAYLSKPPKATTIKKIPLEYIIKPKNQNDKNALEKPNDETEFSAENLPGKASLSSVQNGSQTTYCQPFSGNPVAVPPPGDMGPWNYNPPPGHGHGHGHQWLIPVMSPSEGLVYKPYPGPPGFMNPVVYGGPGPGPMMGHNFGHYGVPPSDHHYESPTGVHPFAPPASHGYFPSYNMPPVNHPVNSPVNSTVNPPVKITATKHSEVQASTASSRSDRTRNRNVLPLFPTSPPVAAAVPVEAPATSRVEVVGPEKEPPRVIRVVPHNARSATASVARIFRSIQEERKQCGE